MSEARDYFERPRRALRVGPWKDGWNVEVSLRERRYRSYLLTGFKVLPEFLCDGSRLMGSVRGFGHLYDPRRVHMHTMGDGSVLTPWSGVPDPPRHRDKI